MTAAQPFADEDSANAARKVDASKSYFHDLLRTLWPEPTAITTGRRASRAQDAALDYVVVPNLQQPKLLLPRRPRRVTAAALRNYKSSAIGSDRLRIRVLSGLARIGCADLLPGRISIASGHRPDAEGGIDRYLSTALGRDLLVSVYIGPQRAVQKPILQLLSPGGQTFAFVKVGVNALTKSLVRSETESLRFLGGGRWSRLVVPEILHSGQWRANEVLVQRALLPAVPESVAPLILAEAMVELARARDTTHERLCDSPYWSTLRTRLAALEPSDLVALLISALDRLEPAAAAATMEFGSWHGDWTPWNMAKSDERLMVWDWEQFETGVPIGFDAVHYSVQRDVVISSHDPATAFELARIRADALLAPFGIAPESAALVVTLYLIEIATRYLHDGEVEAGTRMGNLPVWLPQVLSKHLSCLDLGR